MVQVKGLPAFFLTLSSNDKYWGDLQSIYAVQSSKDLALAVKNEPFTAVAYFRAKLLTFLSKVLYGKLGVSDHFVKFEFQGRGSIHAHILLWHPCTKDIFSNGSFNSDKAIYWSNKVVSAINPYVESNEADFSLLEKKADEIDDPIEHANKLLNVCVRHTKCGVSCLRNNKCRFHYPKPLQAETKIKFEQGEATVLYQRNDPLVQTHSKVLLG